MWVFCFFTSIFLTISRPYGDDNLSEYTHGVPLAGSHQLQSSVLGVYSGIPEISKDDHGGPLDMFTVLSKT